MALPPKDFPRNAFCPPRGRGNERFLLSFIGCARSAQAPGTVRNPIRAGEISCITTIQPSRATPAETFVLRPARVPRNHFPRCKPRALPEIRDDRLPLHKRPVSTSPLPLLLAFSRTLPMREGTVLTRPDLLPQSGRVGGYSRRGTKSPSGRTFSVYFSVRSEK